jgi:hypothetical protein
MQHRLLQRHLHTHVYYSTIHKVKTNFILKWGNKESNSSKIRNKTRGSTFTTFIQYSAWNFCQNKHLRERNKKSK